MPQQSAPMSGPSKPMLLSRSREVTGQLGSLRSYQRWLHTAIPSLCGGGGACAPKPREAKQDGFQSQKFETVLGDEENFEGLCGSQKSTSNPSPGSARCKLRGSQTIRAVWKQIRLVWQVKQI